MLLALCQAVALEVFVRLVLGFSVQPTHKVDVCNYTEESATQQQLLPIVAVFV